MNADDMNFHAVSPDDNTAFSDDVSEIQGFLEQICGMEAETFGAPWKQQDFLSELQSGDSRCMVLLQNGVLTGYLFAKAVCDEINLNKICITSRMRGKGLGALLLRRFLEVIKGEYSRMFLEVDSTNTSAVRLYTALGFRTGRIRKAIYENGADGFEMVLEL